MNASSDVKHTGGTTSNLEFRMVSERPTIPMFPLTNKNGTILFKILCFFIFSDWNIIYPGAEGDPPNYFQ